MLYKPGGKVGVGVGETVDTPVSQYSQQASLHIK